MGVDWICIIIAFITLQWLPYSYWLSLVFASDTEEELGP